MQPGEIAQHRELHFSVIQVRSSDFREKKSRKNDLLEKLKPAVKASLFHSAFLPSH